MFSSDLISNEPMGLDMTILTAFSRPSPVRANLSNAIFAGDRSYAIPATKWFWKQRSTEALALW